MTHSVADMLFPDVRFAHILSLGGRNAAHCRDAPIPQEVSTVFDRLVGPLDALAAILADDGARLGTRLVASHGGKEVRCGAYGVLYPCAFRRDESGQVEFDDGDLELCRADFAAAMTAFLRTCEAASGPILFLRDGLETDLPWDRVSQPAGTSFALDVLMVAIVRRFPALEFRILVSVHDADLQGGEQALDSRVAIVSRPPSGETWGMVFAHLAGRDHAFGGQPSRVPEPVIRQEPVTRQELVTRLEPVASLQLESASSGASPEALPSYLAARLAEGSATAEQAWKTGSDLWHAHRPNLAGQAFALAYEHGCRDLDFLHDYLTLLTGEAQYRKVADLAASLRREGLAERPLVARRLAMVGGHAKLALALPRDHEIALSGARAASPAWLEAPALHRTIARAIEERRPFSFIRVGDGEARFLLGETGGVDGVLTAEEATAIGGVVWKNWFGEPLEAADPVRRAALAETYRQAVGAADVIGACSPGRLQSDTGHYGYLAWQERWLRRTFAGPHYTDALVHRQLNAEDPFLATLLEGQDALGVISPHPDLAAALGARLRIRRVIGHSVPAEGRLPNAIETRAKGPHFPTVYDKIMATLSVPCRGCVFLVAAGLLGKIYCARIKELGGIALDIGALADAWMGHDTRDGQFTGTPRLEVPLPAPALIRPSAPATDETGPARTILCLSMMKTGSTAIAESLRDAAFGEDVAHLHHLGPLARARLPTLGRPVNEVAARLADPHHRFAVMTCVRDPIARWISEIFHDAAADPAAANLIEDHGAFVAYVEAKKKMDYSTAWFDDSLKTMFGIDFRQHAFDHSRKSLRHDTDRLRLLVLRQEDPAPHKESELGWFLGRDRVSLHRRNERSPGRLASRYLEFRETFVAPERWLDVFYGSEVVRHFYTHEERTMFRERWGPRHAAAAGAAHPEARTASDPRIEAGEPLVLAANGTIETPHSPETVMPHVLPDQDPVLAELGSLRARLRDGHAVDFNDYAYRPRERDWTGSVAANSLRAMFAERRGTYADLLDRFCGFDPFFRAIPVLPASGAPHWENWWLPGLDAVALYGLVATQAPRTYLEIGSGHSTRFVRQAIRDHGLPTRIVSIDPDPVEEIQALCDEVVRLRCEEAPTSLFASLGAGDILFFDGSHRSFQNSDATVFFTEILPSLAPGVIYGIHDIFLPYDYPDSWKERFYNEQYLLMTYLLGGAGSDEVVFPAHHIWREPAYAPLRNRLFLGSRHLDWLTSSFWMRRGPAPRGRA